MKEYCPRICDYLLCFRTVEYTFYSVHCNVYILHMQCTSTYDCTSIVCKVLKGYSLPYLIILRNETTFKSSTFKNSSYFGGSTIFESPVTLKIGGAR